jgi:hypothetical protein
VSSLTVQLRCPGKKEFRPAEKQKLVIQIIIFTWALKTFVQQEQIPKNWGGFKNHKQFPINKSPYLSYMIKQILVK